MEAMKTIGQLSEIGGGHWETHTDVTENKELEPDALADKFEEETTNEGVLDTLEERLKEVTDALERIETGNFGKCVTCAMNGIDKDIEKAPRSPRDFAQEQRVLRAERFLAFLARPTQ